jgi:UDPglucose--hexose-1-phosphate uridylyltransferase
MAKFVPDVNTRRWVVIAPSRSSRPQDKDKDIDGEEKAVTPEEEFPEKDGYHHSDSCPFCYGNEERTPPEIYRWGKNDPHDDHWIVRVVPNKYPITDIHEVIVHSPDHVIDIDRFPVEHVEVLYRVYRQRYNELKDRGQVIIFVNVGEDSGASLRHPHSQIVVVPRQINLDVVAIEPIGNIIEEGENFNAWSPDFSQWPWEVWIAPKVCCQREHDKGERCYFGGIADEQIPEFSRFVQSMIQRLLKRFPGASYNYYIYPGECWYLRLIPRLVHRAGFELGTGLSVNIADPTDVAEELSKNGRLQE